MSNNDAELVGPQYHLAATAQDGSALYQFRNYRTGGSYWKVVRDGKLIRHTSLKPRPTVGRWSWVKLDD